MSRYFSYCAFMLSVVVAGSSYIGLCAASGVIFITFLGTVPSDLTFVTPRRNARRKKRPYLPQPLNYTIHTHTPLSYSFRTHPFYLSPVPFPSATRARQRFSYFRARPIGPLKKKKTYLCRVVFFWFLLFARKPYRVVFASVLGIFILVPIHCTLYGNRRRN